MVERRTEVERVLHLLRRNPVVAVIGARQVGKSTLAREVAGRSKGTTTFFDLEDPAHLRLLDEPTQVLRPIRGLVVIDEVQRRPELFPVLRVLADRPRGAKFLVLGSAAPELLRQSSESLAGRIAYHHLEGFALGEVGSRNLNRLWLRGGFPRSFTARTDADAAQWRLDFVRTFLERDLPQLGIRTPEPTLRRFWSMLAHVHGQTLNWSELGRSMGVADTTVRGYLDALTGTFVVRQLQPWFENISKRQVRSPKVFIADSGLLHTLLDVDTRAELQVHPKVGASWEGFCIGEVVKTLGARPDQCFFWATHAGAELDLLVVAGGKRRGFEVKLTDAPRVTPSMRTAFEDLKLESLDVIHAGAETTPLGPGIRAVSATRLLDDLRPLRSG